MSRYGATFNMSSGATQQIIYMIRSLVFSAKGEYNSETAYLINDVITYQNELYITIKDITRNLITN